MEHKRQNERALEITGCAEDVRLVDGGSSGQENVSAHRRIGAFVCRQSASESSNRRYKGMGIAGIAAVQLEPPAQDGMNGLTGRCEQR